MQPAIMRWVCIFGILAGLFGVGGAVPLWALDEVTFEAMMDKDKAKVGENVQYLISIQYGLNTMAPNITAPSFNQFTVINDYQTIQTKGSGPDQYQVLKKIWLLSPNEPGRLSIAAAIITYQDPTTNLLKTGKTQVQFLQVSTDNKPAPTAENKPVAASPAPSPKKVMTFALAAGGVVLGLGLILAWVALRRPSAPKHAPEDEAMRALDRAIGHAEQENLEAYYAALHRAFLDYLQNKFSIDGDLLATPALLARMQEYGFGKGILEGLESFLKTADRAKFGGYVPHEDEMIVLHGVVKKFIEAGRKVKVKTAKKKPKRDEDEE